MIKSEPYPYFKKIRITLKHERLSGLFKRVGLIIMAAGYLFYFAAGQRVSALPDCDLQSINGPWVNFVSNSCDTTASCFGGPGVGTTGTPTENQINNAKIIMGIAKTENLGQQGALIGLMVGLDESGLQNYANKKMPVSLGFPHEAEGSDYDSVGVFQQRVVTNWSTLNPGNGAASGTPTGSQNYSNGFPDAVQQIMTPAYAAEAFFGSPPGSGAPSALSKGLQNKPGWQSQDPAVVAQSIQGSGDSTGSNYRAKQGAAQALLNQYWDAAPPVPLPVPLNAPPAGSGASAPTGGCRGVPGDVKELARQILDNANISYPLDGSSSNGSTKAVLEALANGQLAPVTCRDGTAGSTTETNMNANVLKFVLDLGQQGPVGVNALTDKCHSSGSNHYKGIAVDFECGGVPFDVAKGDVTAQKYGGMKNSETCGANNHWHYDFLTNGSGT